MKSASELAPIQFADYQARRGLAPPWANGRRAKEFRAVMGARPIGGIFSVGRRGAVPLEGLGAERGRDPAVGGRRRPPTACARGSPSSRASSTTGAGCRSVERIYGWHHRHERYLRNTRSLARVALLASEQTSTFYKGGARAQRPATTSDGMYHALVEARVPFEMVHEALLTPDRIDRLRAPRAGQRRRAVRRAVRRAPRVRRARRQPASPPSRRRSTTNGARGAPTSASRICSASSFDGGIDGPMQNSYLSLDADPTTGRRHPCSPASTKRRASSTAYGGLEVTADGPRCPSPLTLIPSYPDLPMEDVYPRVPHTDVRELYLREIGRARVAYFPWDIDRTFWEVLSVDHGRLLRNAVAWAARRRAAGHRRPARACSTSPSGGSALDDRAPRQPHQPDDDEGAAARADPGRSSRPCASGCPTRRASAGCSCSRPGRPASDPPPRASGSRWRCHRWSITRWWRSTWHDVGARCPGCTVPGCECQGASARCGAKVRCQGEAAGVEHPRCARSHRTWHQHPGTRTWHPALWTPWHRSKGHPGTDPNAPT